MTRPDLQVVPFAELSSQQRRDFTPYSNWQATFEDGVLLGLTDPVYGSFVHVAIVKNGEIMFDKIDIQFAPAVFIAVMRTTPDGDLEFLTIREKRILLENSDGHLGRVVNSIPQGLIKPGESSERAALRETGEETGLSLEDVISLSQLATIYIDPANSSTAMPFYLMEVSYHAQQGSPVLEDSEAIETHPWKSWEEIVRTDFSGDLKAMGMMWLVYQQIIFPQASSTQY